MTKPYRVKAVTVTRAIRMGLPLAAFGGLPEYRLQPDRLRFPVGYDVHLDVMDCTTGAAFDAVAAVHGDGEPFVISDGWEPRHVPPHM